MNVIEMLRQLTEDPSINRFDTQRLHPATKQYLPHPVEASLLDPLEQVTLLIPAAIGALSIHCRSTGRQRPLGTCGSGDAIHLGA